MLSVYSEAIDYGIKINLSLMILNLVPALPLDGGRIAKSYYINKFRSRSGLKLNAENQQSANNRNAACFSMAAPYQRLQSVADTIGAFLLGNLSIEQKNISLISLKEILYYKTRLKKNRILSELQGWQPMNQFPQDCSCGNWAAINII